ncbi:MAG TPA: HepT-like ribonuclease domain-containing protein [Thermomicrobiales bacterium]|nr:HepT-like ribonuclease domain-containing protein [Thermomicrobiales bacterium]
MQPKTPGLLWDILTAARFVLEHTSAISLAEYEENLLLRSAIERQLEIVGEASRRLARIDADTAAAIPDLPRIIAFRNVLAHAYDVIDNARVWEIITEYLPQLAAQVESLLDTDTSDSALAPH